MKVLTSASHTVTFSASRQDDAEEKILSSSREMKCIMSDHIHIEKEFLLYVSMEFPPRIFTS